MKHKDKTRKMLKLGHFWNYIRNALEVSKCGAGEKWKRSIEPIT
jgi:hypothetical protein